MIASQAMLRGDSHFEGHKLEEQLALQAPGKGQVADTQGTSASHTERGEPAHAAVGRWVH